MKRISKIVRLRVELGLLLMSLACQQETFLSRSAARPSDQTEEVDSFLDSLEQEIYVEEETEVEFVDTNFLFPSGVANSNFILKLERQSGAPALPNTDEVTLSAVDSSVVHIQIVDSVTKDWLSSSQILIPYEFTQRVESAEPLQDLALVVLTDPDTDHEKFVIIDDLEVNQSEGSGLTGRWQTNVSVKLRLTNAIVWLVQTDIENITTIEKSTGTDIVTGSTSDDEVDDLSNDSESTFKLFATGGQGNHSCVILDDGSLKCWGNNGFGQLGQGHTSNIGAISGSMSGLQPIDFGFGKTVKQVGRGTKHTCAIFTDNELRCWGTNTQGELGINNTNDIGDQGSEMSSLTAVYLGPGRHATQISLGNQFSCALLDDGTVKCWGKNDTGQLGQGSLAGVGQDVGDMQNLQSVVLGSNHKATEIAAGMAHVCVLMDDKQIKCWGYNYYGQLGQDNTDVIGDMVGEIQSLNPVNLGPGRTALHIAAGGHHSCAILDDGTVKCWGYNYFGQLGLGHLNDRGASPGSIMMDERISFGPSHSAVQITAGSHHTCVLLDNGSARCWGANTSGQLGINSVMSVGGSAGDMTSLSDIHLGQGRTALQLSAGSTHNCALLDDYSVKCWGDNVFGQLGQEIDFLMAIGDSSNEMESFVDAIYLGVGRNGWGL